VSETTDTLKVGDWFTFPTPGQASACVADLQGCGYETTMIDRGRGKDPCRYAVEITAVPEGEDP